MLSDQEKKEMLEDGLSHKRKMDFLLAEQSKPKRSRTLNNYIAFLMDVQKIKPFQHLPSKTITEMNIL